MCENMILAVCLCDSELCSIFVILLPPLLPHMSRLDRTARAEQLWFYTLTVGHLPLIRRTGDTFSFHSSNWGCLTYHRPKDGKFYILTYSSSFLLLFPLQISSGKSLVTLRTEVRFNCYLWPWRFVLLEHFAISIIYLRCGHCGHKARRHCRCGLPLFTVATNIANVNIKMVLWETVGEQVATSCRCVPTTTQWETVVFV